MEDGATQEQIDLIKGRKGSLCVVVEVPAAEWVSPVAALMRRLGEWDKMAVEDVDRIARNEEVMLVIGAKLVEGGIELWDREGPVSFEKFIKRGLEASHVWRLIVQHIDHIELDLDLRDVRGLPLRDALHV